jgi:hypothetical protein
MSDRKECKRYTKPTLRDMEVHILINLSNYYEPYLCDRCSKYHYRKKKQ